MTIRHLEFTIVLACSVELCAMCGSEFADINGLRGFTIESRNGLAPTFGAHQPSNLFMHRSPGLLRRAEMERTVVGKLGRGCQSE